MLAESDIVPGRYYLCRVFKMTPQGRRWTHAVMIAEGPRITEDGEPISVLQGFDCHRGWVGDGSTEVIRELDLEAMAAECERPKVKPSKRPCLGDACQVCGHSFNWHVHPGGRTCAYDGCVCDDFVSAECETPGFFSWDDVTEARFVPRDSKSQAKSGVRLSHGPTGAWARYSVHRSYHENLAAARARLTELLVGHGFLEPQAPRWSDEVEVEIERVAE